MTKETPSTTTWVDRCGDCVVSYDVDRYDSPDPVYSSELGAEFYMFKYCPNCGNKNKETN